MSSDAQENDKTREVLAEYRDLGDDARLAERAQLMAKTNSPAGQGAVCLTGMMMVINGNTARSQSPLMTIRDFEMAPAVDSCDNALTKRRDNWLMFSRKLTPEAIGEARLTKTKHEMPADWRPSA